MRRNSISVIKMGKVAILLLGACFAVSISTKSVAKETPKEKANSEVTAASELLNAWRGQSEILEQAKSKLIPVLKANPQDYFALKEIARYQIMNGYIKEGWAQYRDQTYTVGEYVPGTLEQAEATIREAIRINPRFADGYVLLGHILFSQTKLDEAEKALTQAETLGTNDPWLHLNWAALLKAKGEDLAATERWQRVLQSNTSNTKALSAAYGFLIKKYIEEEKHDKAVELFEEQIKRTPTDPWLRGNFANYLTGTLDRNDEAILQARAALKIMNYGVGQRTLAMALYRKWAQMVVQGNDSKAEEYFKEAQEIFPELNEVMAYGVSMPACENLAKALMTKKGVSIDAPAEDGSTALLIATNQNRVKTVQILLNLKANPNIADKKGWTPLLSAADEGNTEIVNMLLEKGADIRATIKGLNAADLAKRRDYIVLAALLRKRAANLK